jgi:hypothetical protein
VTTHEIDPLIYRIVTLLHDRPGLEELVGATANTYLKEAGYERLLRDADELVSSVASAVVDVLPLKPGVLLLLKLMSHSAGLEKTVRQIILGVSIESALLIARNALAAAGGARKRKLQLNAAFNELERARVLLDDSLHRGRDLFVINLLQAFCASYLNGGEGDAERLYREAAQMLEKYRAELTARADASLENERATASGAAHLREVIRDGGEESFLMELGEFSIKENDPMKRTPAQLRLRVSGMARQMEKEAVQIRIEVERLRAEEARLTDVINKLCPAC